MSRLFSPDEPEEVRSLFLNLGADYRTPRIKTKAKTKALGRRRRRARHPEQIEQDLRERSKRSMPESGWHWPFGWLLLMWRPDGTKRRLDYPPHFSYNDVVKERDHELRTGDYEGATLIRKTYEPRTPKPKT